jgi:DNA-binding HxlR family transcriptional regulator
MIDYGRFCSVARGAEAFGERWTPLVVRELLCGSTCFDDSRRGVPRMSSTLGRSAFAGTRSACRAAAAS